MKEYEKRGYELYETSVCLWNVKWDNSISIRNISVNLGLIFSELTPLSEEEIEERLATITPKEEVRKIWDNFDYFALRKAANEFKYEGEPFHITIKNYEHFVEVIKKLGLYEPYLKEKESIDERRKLLLRDDLIEVKFRKYTSWETGCSFLILSERVDKKIFYKLKKGGLYYHMYDEDNEERFNDWCINNNEECILRLAENGIRAIITKL